MRDTFYNAIAYIALVAFLVFVTFTVVTVVSNGHPSEDCREDEVWAPVHYQTQGASQDSRGVTRMCVNIEEL